MNERPILFSGPMVRAILGGRKTMTRRVIKPQPDARCTAMITHGIEWLPLVTAEELGEVVTRGDVEDRRKCPYGQPGDRLWVRETWAHTLETLLGSASEHEEAIYRATHDNSDGCYIRWRPSIFMPRRASRITLEVTAVRVERLQEISEADARAEGIDRRMDGPDEEYSGASGKWGWNPVTAFRHLWDGINAERGYPWESNPWVWVVAFKLVENRA